MIDVHCHLQFKAFNQDYEVIAKRAFEVGVKRIINVGTMLDSSRKAVDLAEKYEQMYAIIGVHPHHADKIDLTGHPESAAWQTKDPQRKSTQILPLRPIRLTQGRTELQSNVRQAQGQNDNRSAQNENESWIRELEEMAKHPKVVGIGEIGLDYFSYKANGIVDPVLQRRIFIKQIELAYRLKLPLQIHNRQAGNDIIEILSLYKDLLLDPPGMLHCFAGSMDVLKKALELGFYIGFDGNVTYDGLAKGETTDLKDLAKYVPLDRLVVETDSPFLSPVPYRGTRNEPAYVMTTGKFLAELKKIPFETLVEQTTDNVYNIFTKMR